MLRNALLKRSIFDILMDIWYLPTLSQYIKLFMNPFFTKITPEEATKLLEDFDQSQRKVFLTKGIINIFPNKMKTLLLPSENERINQSQVEGLVKSNPIEENHSDSTRSDIAADNSRAMVLYKNSNEDFVSPTCVKRPRKLRPPPFSLERSAKIFFPVSTRRFKIQRKRKSSKFSVRSNISALDKSEYEFIVENSLDRENNRKDKIIQQISDSCEKKPNYDINIPNPSIDLKVIESKKVEKNPKNTNSRDDYRFYEIDDDAGGKKVYRTLVLESTEKMKSRMERVTSTDSLKDIKNFCWDNLNKYYDQEAKKAIRGNKTTKSNFFQLFSKFLRQQIISKIDYNKLSKAFAIFCLTLLVQMIISKRARRWSISFIQFLFYMVTSLGAGGTLYFLLLKMKK